MSQYQKTIVVKTLPGKKKVTNWAALHDVSILDSLFQEKTMRFKGKREYRSPAKFGVGLLFLWIVIGLAIGVAFSGAGNPGAGAGAWVTFPLGYTIYHFVRHRAKSVEFEILSVDSENQPAVRIAGSDDFDEVKADINSLAMSLI